MWSAPNPHRRHGLDAFPMHPSGRPGAKTAPQTRAVTPVIYYFLRLLNLQDEIQSPCPPRARSSGHDWSFVVTIGRRPKAKSACLSWLFRSEAAQWACPEKISMTFAS